ncbi:Hypp4593 [Branchiostoma lanceolatum]|uniref:Hypp4593 protein n=1 Tax=Branchiostoma lanceolatum TaxID=7740 RepID=A0A8K0A8C1_BRALA|nr:Hypp4593 [Branchiostoma lanceolatum]
MRLFVGTLLVTMLVVAMLIDDSEGWRRRRRRRSKKQKNMEGVADDKLAEVMQEARYLLDELEDLDDLDDLDNMAAERAPMEARGAGYEDNDDRK